MAEGHIILQDLRKSFGSKHVLNGINLSVPKGHSLVVIGGSGTGKSVMLKCILGILHADSGSIQIGGEEITGLKGKARDEFLRRFGMLFKGGALFDSLPVWENVAFGLIQGRTWRALRPRTSPSKNSARLALTATWANSTRRSFPAACRSA